MAFTNLESQEFLNWKKAIKKNAEQPIADREPNQVTSKMSTSNILQFLRKTMTLEKL